MGSTTQHRPPAVELAPPSSSPNTGSPGRHWASSRRANRSAAVSAAVTTSVALVLVPTCAAPPARILTTKSPTCWTTATAVARNCSTSSPRTLGIEPSDHNPRGRFGLGSDPTGGLAAADLERTGEDTDGQDIRFRGGHWRVRYQRLHGGSAQRVAGR